MDGDERGLYDQQAVCLPVFASRHATDEQYEQDPSVCPGRSSSIQSNCQDNAAGLSPGAAMNASLLLPKDVLLALRPDEIDLCLTRRGWTSEPYGAAGQGLQFRHSAMPGIDLLLPLTRDLGDYTQRMADLIVVLTTIEQRPVWEVLRDLSGPSGNIIRQSK
jgi:hypothetical protein